MPRAAKPPETEGVEAPKAPKKRTNKPRPRKPRAPKKAPTMREARAGVKRKVEALKHAVEDAKSLEPNDRVRWLRDQALELYADARSDGSHVAAEKALRAVLALDQQLQVIEQEERARDEASAEGVSEAEYLERLTSRAATMADTHLEVFVTAWLERHPHARLVVTGGLSAG